MIVDVCFSTILYPYYRADKFHTVVIIDVFRATSTICTALNNGATSIIPVEKLEEVVAYKQKGLLVGGERNVERCDFADFGNSPFEYSSDKVSGQDIAFSTTNGTRAINIALEAKEMIMGSFLNLNSVVDRCASEQKGVLILCSGWRNRFNVEDSLCGGAIATQLVEKYGYSIGSDSVRVAMAMWREAKEDLSSYIRKTEHYDRLALKNLEKDIEYCLSLNLLKIVPTYNVETKKITI